MLDHIDHSGEIYIGEPLMMDRVHPSCMETVAPVSGEEDIRCA